MLVTLAGSWLVLSVMTQPLAGAARQANAQTAAPTGKLPEVTAEGRWQSTVQDAWTSAQAQAHLKIIEHFRHEGLAFERVPPMDELRPVLAKYWKVTPEDKNFPDDVGLMHRIVLKVPVTPEIRAYMQQQDRLQRSQDRMLFLGKVLFAVVMMLAGVSGYLYLDEWTKGYAGWLWAGPIIVIVVLVLTVCLVL
jgi:hypothetical protein